MSTNRPQNFLDKKMYVLLTAGEIYGTITPINKIQNQLAKFNRLEVVSILSRINLLLNIFGQGNIDLQRELAEGYFPLKTRELFDTTIRKYSAADRSPSGYVIFHRRQLLTLMQITAVVCTDEESQTPLLEDAPDEHRYRLGECMLAISDYVGSIKENDIDPKDPEAIEYLAMEALPSYELDNEAQLAYDFTRTDLLLKDFYPTAPGEVSVLDKFKQKYGISIEEFRGFAFAHWGLYRQKPEKGKNANYVLNREHIFKNSKISEDKKNKFWEMVGVPLDKLAESIYADRRDMPEMAFATFRKMPILLYEQMLIPLDIDFLIEMVSSAFFWAVHSALNETERDILHRDWGQSFEKYTTQLLLRKYPVGSWIFYPNVKDTKGDEIADGILFDGGRMAILEYKGTPLSFRSKYAGSRREFLRTINSAFIFRNGRPQLANAIKRLLSKDGDKFFNDNKVDKTKIRKIFPVVITLDKTSQSFLMPSYLRQKFTKETAGNNYPIPIAPLTACHISSLEMLESYSGSETFLDIIEKNSYQQAPLDPTLEDQVKQILNNAGVSFNNNPALAERWKEIGHSMVKVFFPEKDLKDFN